MHSVSRWLVLILLVTGNDAFSAGCKFDTDSTDKFTKERTLGTRRDSLESFWGDSSKDEQKDLYVSAWYNNGERALRVDILLTRYVNRMPPPYQLRNTLVIPKGSRLLVKMADDTIVTLLSANPISSDSRATRMSGSVSVDTGAIIYYPLNDELMAALTSQGAAKLRVEAADTHYDLKIDDKSLDDIGNAIRCLQAEL